MYETQEQKEKVILFGVQMAEGDDTWTSLLELKDLADTAGAETVGYLIQNREAPHPGTYLGKGKIEELKEQIWEKEATGVICDDELSPAQLNNLTSLLNCKVMDRTLIILDIFAARASTREGKIQVELAQLKYRSARLIGLRDSLSRLGGGIGTRGPGESKLEIDRRRIHDRISWLKGELKEVERHRDVTRQKRSEERIPVAAIVGYTNAGKSTLLNTLTGAGILAEDKLFATLDPTTRVLPLPGGEKILLTDTVGFIRKLPHHLIEAFKSTLEEAKYADIILHVVDSSSPQADTQMYVVYDTLKSLGVEDKTVITLFNKSDRFESKTVNIQDHQADHTLSVSAVTGQGLPELKDLLAQILRERKIYIERTYDYKDMGKLQLIRKYGQLLSEEYQDEGVKVTGYIPMEWIEKI
jgi:GTP-binding protein HflX